MEHWINAMTCTLCPLWPSFAVEALLQDRRDRRATAQRTSEEAVR